MRMSIGGTPWPAATRSDASNAMTDSAAFLVSAKTTPTPWVPSSNLMTNGAPPTILIK